ncbi:MAG: hypothetical protein RE472_03010 [Thermoplasmatales archaeon]|nr:MAG: hypothetical protein RE472_09920 [Thermoplasmatales archaeon]WMT49948.1 MAG: hypothetical protein RE472_03010 [Thermoplasmatales archaeon]
MERQLVFGDSLEIKLEVQLDRIDQAILSIFSSHPTRSYKVHQIKTILDYRDIVLSPQRIEKRLSFLVITTVLSRRKGSRVYLYCLNTSST